jgi:6-phosphogluconolactonase
MHARSRRRLRTVCGVAGAISALAVAAGNATAAGTPGAVYVQANSAPMNFVHVFWRGSDGALTPGPVVATGGSGVTITPPLGFPVTDSQGAVALSQDGRLLFAVNAGSNTVSSFRVTPDGLVLVDQEPSRGPLPISVAVTNRGIDRKLLYVLNENPSLPCFPLPIGCGSGPGTLSGYHVSSSGEMTPIPGGTKAVSGSLSAQVGFDAHGDLVTVTNRGNNTISTYPVGHDGRLGPEHVTVAAGAGEPFGFEYTKRNQLVVSDSAGAGTTSTYSLSPHDATLTPIDVEASGGIAPCWVALTDDNRYAYVTNAITMTVARFHLSPGGALALLGTTPVDGFALDEDTSNGSRYLYVLSATAMFTPFPLPGPGRITAFEIGSDGGLTPIGTVANLPTGTSGLAAT